MSDQIISRIDKVASPPGAEVYTPPIVGRFMPHQFGSELFPPIDRINDPSDVHRNVSRIGTVLIAAGLVMLGQKPSNAWRGALSDESIELAKSGEAEPSQTLREAQRDIPQEVTDAWGGRNHGWVTANTLLELGVGLRGLGQWSLQVGGRGRAAIHNGRPGVYAAQQQHHKSIKNQQTGQQIGEVVHATGAVTELLMSVEGRKIDGSLKPSAEKLVHYAATGTHGDLVIAISADAKKQADRSLVLTVRAEGLIHETIGKLLHTRTYQGTPAGLVKKASQIARHILPANISTGSRKS